jgi:hypothetical protein
MDEKERARTIANFLRGIECFTSGVGPGIRVTLHARKLGANRRTRHQILSGSSDGNIQGEENSG